MGSETSQVCFYGVGVGPGDPELLTLKAYRVIREADVVAYLMNDRGISQAQTIAQAALDDGKEHQQYLPIQIPMTTTRGVVNNVYDQASADIQTALSQGKSVAFLCEGDPLFFGSFAYLLERIEGKYPCQVIPGVTSISAGSAALGLPLTMLKESLAVVSGRHTDDYISQILSNVDTVVIMKAGLARERLMRLIEEAGRTDDANYLQYISRDNEYVTTDITTLDKEPGPYFSLFILTRTPLACRGQNDNVDE
ncbi:Precorrin-2 C(20)-methyltransferase [BD1-7 clade bacterium]|uniref:Precorrin-2 C(20)-methyltransferase n=1 Tax=BD1-7 clade bacterium TaxID=2029982 RepID=A0A5S9PEA6_9GAMM|nr:Precorrin-2 C(20)-methyltransferase [BD1-7 clade bacterium]CAA0102156.1 Precorrin-2 C(20)-methyltransferase [BD1-7 clade bacterium]